MLYQLLPMVDCQETSVFFKKRAVLEEDYGRGMQKLAKMTSEVYSLNDGKAGCDLSVNCITLYSYALISSFVKAWQSTMKIHEIMAENRIKFAQRLNEMSDELANLAKEVEKNRKSVRYSFPRFRGMFYFSHNL